MRAQEFDSAGDLMGVRRSECELRHSARGAANFSAVRACLSYLGGKTGPGRGPLQPRPRLPTSAGAIWHGCRMARMVYPSVGCSHDGHAPRRRGARSPGRGHGRRRGAAPSARPRAGGAGRTRRRGAARPLGAAARRAPRSRSSPTRAAGEDALWLVRHDTAHVLAAAVMELYPGVKISIGPPIDDGFYYDFEFPEGVKLSDEDFERIEAEMREHVKADEAVHARGRARRARRSSASSAEGQDYKVELIEDLVRDEGVETVSLYTNGPFTDLCRGPHAPSTKRIKAFKLQSVAGAYWRGDSDRPMLTRVYGTAFLSKEELDAAPRAARGGARARPPQARPRARTCSSSPSCRRARRSGSRNGAAIWNELTDLWRRENAAPRLPRGQARRSSTTSTSGSSSGHWDKYRDNMYFTEVEERPMGLKPMNCPAHIQIYKSRAPLLPRPADPLRRGRASCTATSRAARCTACCACATSPRTTPTSSAPRSRSRTRSTRCLDFGFAIYDVFGFEPRLELSTRPEKRDRHRRDVGPRRGGAAARARRRGPRVRAQRGRRRLLRPEDRPAHDRLDRPLVAARDRPARLLDARALRARRTPAPTTPTTGR